jgi:hypothetical protein
MWRYLKIWYLQQKSLKTNKKKLAIHVGQTRSDYINRIIQISLKLRMINCILFDVKWYNSWPTWILTNLSIYVQDTTSFACHIMFYSRNKNRGTERKLDLLKQEYCSKCQAQNTLKLNRVALMPILLVFFFFHYNTVILGITFKKTYGYAWFDGIPRLACVNINHQGQD